MCNDVRRVGVDDVVLFAYTFVIQCFARVRSRTINSNKS